MLLVLNPDGEVLLTRRPSEGLWGGLWSFPEVEDEPAGHRFCLDRFNLAPVSVDAWEPLRHTFSHYHLDIHPLKLTLPDLPGAVMEGDRQLWYNRRSPDRVGVAAPVARLITMLDIEEPRP